MNICLSLPRETIYDINELGFCIGVRVGLLDWLESNIGKEVSYTDLQNWTDLQTGDWGISDYAMTTVEIHFKDADKAMLFKLVWL